MTFGCDEARRWLDAWADQELDASAAVHVEAHMSHCRVCRAEAESLKIALIRLTGFNGRTSKELKAALDQVDHVQETEASSVKRRKHALGFVLTGATLASVVLASGHRPGVPQSTMNAAMLPVAEDCAQRHARELHAEVQASDPAAVSQWFRGKIDVPVRPVMFRNVLLWGMVAVTLWSGWDYVLRGIQILKRG
jgi:phosphatidylglycerophosphate synthase